MHTLCRDSRKISEHPNSHPALGLSNNIECVTFYIRNPSMCGTLMKQGMHMHNNSFQSLQVRTCDSQETGDVQVLQYERMKDIVEGCVHHPTSSPLYYYYAIMRDISTVSNTIRYLWIGMGPAMRELLDSVHPICGPTGLRCAPLRPGVISRHSSGGRDGYSGRARIGCVCKWDSGYYGRRAG
uniref:Uncharacterized protein n=2 Tax=Hyaloperonospora arabidopsidis (strain Emoy2) TaxID=559515 RepID=M4C1V9_HYAAE